MGALGLKRRAQLYSRVSFEIAIRRRNQFCCSQVCLFGHSNAEVTQTRAILQLLRTGSLVLCCQTIRRLGGALHWHVTRQKLS